MRAKGATWLGIVVSVGLVAYIASTFDLRGAIEAMRLADPRWLALATLAYCLQFPLRGLRWSILLAPIKPVGPRTATEVFAVGFLANNVLPARLGDLTRAVVLAKREGLSASSTFSSVVLERVFDGMTVVAFLSAVLWLDPPPSAWVGTVAVVMAALFLGAALTCGMVAWNDRLVLQLARTFLRWLPPRIVERCVGLIERLAQGFHTLKSPSKTLKTLALSVVIWGAEVVVYVLAQEALGLSLSPFGLALVMAILTLGLTAPSAPGFFGVYEGLIIAGVGVYGVTDPEAPAFAMTMHLIHFLPGSLFGLFASWRSGLELEELRKAAAGPHDAVRAEDGDACARAEDARHARSVDARVAAHRSGS